MSDFFHVDLALLKVDFFYWPRLRQMIMIIVYARCSKESRALILLEERNERKKNEGGPDFQ
jgi:hypothetical protein